MSDGQTQGETAATPPAERPKTGSWRRNPPPDGSSAAAPAEGVAPSPDDKPKTGSWRRNPNAAPATDVPATPGGQKRPSTGSWRRNPPPDGSTPAAPATTPPPAIVPSGQEKPKTGSFRRAPGDPALTPPPSPAVAPQGQEKPKTGSFRRPPGDPLLTPTPATAGPKPTTTKRIAPSPDSAALTPVPKIVATKPGTTGRRASGAPPDPLAALGAEVQPGATIQLGAAYLAYARQRLSPPALKKELEARLVPAVAHGPSPVVGMAFGKFLVKAPLGQGGMAEVYLANDPETNSDVALKVMRDDLATDLSYVKRFLREAANASLVDHQNVVAVLEVGAVKGRLYFTMEAVFGDTLKARLLRSPLSEREALDVIHDILSGLAAAHARGIAHRDLKPSNVMLARTSSKYGGLEVQGEEKLHVKLMDFGLARMYVDDDEPELDSEGRVLGTAKYVAPEIVIGAPSTLQSDVFSLGILAFEMVAGRSPWKVKHKLEYLTANVHLEAPSLRTVVPEVSQDMATLVAAMLTKDPAVRPSVDSLLRDVERIRQRQGRTPGAAAISGLNVAEDPQSVFYAKRSITKRIAHSERLDDEKAAPTVTPPRLAFLLLAFGVVALALLALALRIKTEPGEQPGEGSNPVTKAPDTRETPRPSTLAAVSPIESKVTPAGQQDEFRLGVPVASLAEVGSQIRDPEGRRSFVRALADGDAAWVARDPVLANEKWQEALDWLGDTCRPLERRIATAAREAALVRAERAEAKGDIEEALNALDDAATRGVAASLLEGPRARLRARRTDEGAYKAALAEAATLAEAHDYEAAVARLAAVKELARTLKRETQVEELAKDYESRRKNEGAASRLRELLEKAKTALDAEELATAEVAIQEARSLGKDSLKLALLAKRLGRMKNVPNGMLYVETDEAKGTGLYVRKKLVTNRELKAWIDAQPLGKRPAGPWFSGDFPADQAELPVKNVKADDAKAFAAAAGQRLATPPENDALQRVLGMQMREGLPDSRGNYKGGFRTVADPGDGEK